MTREPWVWWALAVVAGVMIVALVTIVIAWLNRRVNDQRRPRA
jgi:uncharacterized membrane protein YbhN (UPF0104 family)